jgi:signal transduction histidine kinase/CheY-like chemotaxis protein/HPt (histidine-containing phosphotransfer) domain-containing protein
MQFIERLSIRAKLIVLGMITTSVAMLVACAIFLIYDYRQIKDRTVDEWKAMTRIAAEDASAAVSFNDSDAATVTLRALGLETDLQSSAIFKATGEPLAKYIRADYSGSIPSEMGVEGSRFGNGFLEVWQPIHDVNKKQIGWVYTHSDLRQLHEHLVNCLLVILTVLSGTMVGTYFLVRRLQRVISGPILNLTAVARSVSTAKDYGLRVGTTQHESDELGVLIGCFDEMLSEIQKRDAQLTLHREHLEEEVSERTVELKATNKMLEAARIKAEESSAAKSAFLANMSHEIRTPMTAILGYADLMLAPIQTMSDRINCLQVVRRNARHLMDLINDILDISKIEAEKMTVERIPHDIAQTAVEVVSMLRPRAVAKQLALRVEFVGPIPTRVRTDPLRLKQVLVNLLGNAIKFTEQGEVCLKISVESRQAASHIQFDVCDTGIGMTSEQMGRLFQAFVQADDSMTRRYGGTGLGLVISKRLAQYMGGDLGVKSEIGKGSVFSLWFDGGSLEGVDLRRDLTEATLNVETESVPSEQITLRGRILLAEDGIDNQHLLTMYLTMAGAEVVVAPNGRDACEKMKNERFDIILMDMQMPEMDGYTATSELRKQGFRLPIIALTAHAMSGDRARCLAAGCTDYLTKPIDRELLLRTTASYLQKVVPSAPAPAAPVKPAPNRAVSPPVAGADAVASAMRKAVEGFINRLPARVVSLSALVQTGETEELRRLAHQLKGAGAGYGFPQITEIAARVESLIKGSEQLDKIKTGVDELVELIRSIKGYDRSKETHGSAEAPHH